MRVVIAGGGPAGSTLALLLAQHGIDVTLYTGGSYSRPCGEAIPHQHTWLVPPTRTVEDCIFESTVDAVYNAVFCYAKPRAAYCKPLGDTIRPYGFMLDKERFVECLRSAAERSGAEIVDARIDPRSLARELLDAVVIDARGNAVLGYDALIAVRWYVRDCRFCERYTAYFVFGDFPGYAWAFPHGEIYNVGIGFRLEWASERGLRLDDYLRMASRILGFDPWSARGGDRPASVITLAEPGMPASFNHSVVYVRIGEAGGFIVPYSGEGIRPAIESAMAAAAGIAEGDWSLYERLVKHYRRLHRSYRLLLRLTGGGSRLGRLAPYLADRSLAFEAHSLTPARMLLLLLRGLVRKIRHR